LVKSQVGSKTTVKIRIQKEKEEREIPLFFPDLETI
jgi:hypothetical protein